MTLNQQRRYIHVTLTVIVTLLTFLTDNSLHLYLTPPSSDGILQLLQLAQAGLVCKARNQQEEYFLVDMQQNYESKIILRQKVNKAPANISPRRQLCTCIHVLQAAQCTIHKSTTAHSSKSTLTSPSALPHSLNSSIACTTCSSALPSSPMLSGHFFIMVYESER